ncbi:4Fe-4S binding protein [bacterium]|nr:4Fe-4S binding protein [candidate division CSSED10-310 bacterium]
MKTLLWARRASQLAFLLLFLVLFRMTDYQGSDQLPYAVNVFFRWDPLVAAAVTVASGTIIPALLPAAGFLVLSLVLGRVFCGWLCPLGTILDGCGRLITPRGRGSRRFSHIRYILLVMILVSAVFSLQLVGFFDPFAILVRGLSFVIDPVINLSISAVFTYLYQHAPGWITAISEPLYGFLKQGILPYRQSYFLHGFVSFLLLASIVVMEKLERRFWCRNLCPLGALLSLFSRWSLLRRLPARSCQDCSTCVDDCRMNAFTIEGYSVQEDCVRCMDCGGDCPRDLVGYRFRKPGGNRYAFDISRRRFLGAAAGGIALPLLHGVVVAKSRLNGATLRPPGVKGEASFLRECVRCGECLKVCPTNGLQPALLETDLAGLFSPRLIPRIGYCEFNCTLCGQVCPTSAIPLLSLERKRATVIGSAVVDTDRCLPYQGIPCLVCEEHCPVYDKAIKLRTVTIPNPEGHQVELAQPYVREDLCVGCGICENKCPVSGAAAIRVHAAAFDAAFQPY